SSLGLGGEQGRRRGLNAQQARWCGRQPPVPAAEQRDDGGDEQRADHGRVEEDARGELGGEDFVFGLWAGGQRDEREEQDQRGARDKPAGAPDTSHDGGVCRSGGVVFLTHAREDEHLVVHRQAEQEREHHKRYPRGDRAGGGDTPDLLRAMAALPYEVEHAAGGAGATAPLTPRTCASACATASGEEEPRTSTSCGTSEPAPMPERSIASSPCLASPCLAMSLTFERPSWRLVAARTSAARTSAAP